MKLNELADDMAQLLERAAIWFRGYEANHRAKGTRDSDLKAVTNCHRADEIEAMVAKYRAVQADGQPQLPLPPVSDGVELDMFGWVRTIDENAMKRARK